MLPGELARPVKRRKRTRRKFNVPQKDAVACTWDSESEAECDKGASKIPQNPKSGSKRTLVKRDGRGGKRLPKKDLRNKDIVK